MAQAAQTIDNETEIPLIEEHIETGLTALLANYKPKYTPGGEVENELDEQFRLDPYAPLPQFNHAFADAFEASDTGNPARALYAMVCDPGIPSRTQAIADVSGFTNPHTVLPVAAGTVRCSHLNESRLVLFFERPQGQLLSDLLENGTRLHESKVLQLVLEPACKALLGLRERKVHHGNIHASALFLSDASVLGECFSAPAGTTGHYLYEPVERMMADMLGHGEANEKTDVYALGILVYEAIYGLDKFKSMARSEFIERVLRQGVYNVFTSGGDFSDSFQDFFRGVLNDNAAERWGLDQLAQFISGKRFNMIAPAQPKDASRPFTFGTEQYFSRRLLANALHRNWRDTIRDIRSLKIDRWCDAALHRPELAERIERAMRNGANANANERQVNDMMMRILTVLDPAGPLRTKLVSTRPDGIAIMLAAIIDEKGPERSHLLAMVDSDISSFWVEQAETNKTAEITQAIWRLKRAKTYLELRHPLGFGIERALYELNPTLSCQSPLLKPYHVTTVAELLSTLDAIAKHVAADTSLIDRHIAGFLGAKLDISKEIRIEDLTSIPALAENQELIMLRILAKAQQKHPKLKLVGLCAWAGMRIEKMIDEIHNRVIRKRQKQQLKKLASSGNIRDVTSSIVNRDVISSDMDGFAHALALHDINNKRIDYLNNPLILEYKSRKIGGKMALIISYTVLTVMGYNTMVNLLGI